MSEMRRSLRQRPPTVHTVADIRKEDRQKKRVLIKTILMKDIMISR